MDPPLTLVCVGHLAIFAATFRGESQSTCYAKNVPTARPAVSIACASLCTQCSDYPTLPPAERLDADGRSCAGCGRRMSYLTPTPETPAALPQAGSRKVEHGLESKQPLVPARPPSSYPGTRCKRSRVALLASTNKTPRRLRKSCSLTQGAISASTDG